VAVDPKRCAFLILGFAFFIALETFEELHEHVFWTIRPIGGERHD
jgi:hypothetical protein